MHLDANICVNTAPSFCSRQLIIFAAASFETSRVSRAIWYWRRPGRPDAAGAAAILAVRWSRSPRDPSASCRMMDAETGPGVATGSSGRQVTLSPTVSMNTIVKNVDQVDGGFGHCGKNAGFFLGILRFTLC